MVIFRGYGARCKPPWAEKELLHKIQSARRDANDPAAIARQINPTPGKAPWLSTVQMSQTKNGFLPIPILANAIIYVTNDVNPIGVPRKDAFSGKLMIGTGDSIRGYTDHDLLEITNWLQHEDRKMYSGKDTAQDAVAAVAGRNAYHPVRDYLASLVWDGKERIETWLIRLAGARDDAYVRAASKKWLIGAVARARESWAQESGHAALHPPGARIGRLALNGGNGRPSRGSMFASASNRASWPAM
jgi:hypothetical protein